MMAFHAMFNRVVSESFRSDACRSDHVQPATPRGPTRAKHRSSIDVGANEISGSATSHGSFFRAVGNRTTVDQSKL